MSIAQALPEPEEPENEKNPNANSASGQGSIVPLGWKPSKAHPVPVVRCIQIKKDGVRCGRWSIRGYTKCIKHSGPGALMPDGNVNVYAAAVIEAARLRMIDEVDPAIDGLVALSQPGSAEQIRLKAYTEILDRAGIRGGFEVEVTGEVTVSPVDLLRKRLTELKEGREAVEAMRNGDIVDGEIIESEDQMALFELEHDEAEKSDDEHE